MSPAGQHLADFVISKTTFENLDDIFNFLKKEFKSKKDLNEAERSERVNRTLLELIEKTPCPTFLLGAVLNYIDRVNQEKILGHYVFANFELWLNQFSGLTREENYRIRARIVGKWVPREEYQILFPISMGKTYPGSHFVTAHGSPDLDTTVASFWGWVDAFGARVSEGLHLWNVPGGAPVAQVELSLLFIHLFGNNVFSDLTKTRTSLSLSSIELLSQKGMVRKCPEDSCLDIDHEKTQNAIVLVDREGYYLGDWHDFDGEEVRQVIMLLNAALRWFQSHLQLRLVSLFAKEHLSLKDLPEFTQALFGLRIKEAEPVKEFTEKQLKHLQDYLSKVLHVPQGIECTFKEFAFAMQKLSLFDFQEFVTLVESLPTSSLFDASGSLLEDRPRLFHYLEKIIKGLNQAINSIRLFVERLETALKIKQAVFGYSPQEVSYRADLEEIRSKMSNYPYLTVTYPDREGRLIPLGIVKAADLHKQILGTVTLRDFSNREETKIPSYLEVISIIDHHKSSFSTYSASVILISDSQSSNVQVASAAFAINDRYSTNGMSRKEIEEQMKEGEKSLETPSQKRIFKRLLQRHIVLDEQQGFYIDPQREFIEYLHFLYAILDDTDLLTKVTYRDVECVASLLNRLKSLMLSKEVEIVTFDDLPRDQTFVQEAAARLLQNPDMYSLYRKIYHSKENAVEENLKLCSEGKPSTVFADTKEQNGCCRVGQTKIFAKNVPIFQQVAPKLRKIWLEEAHNFYKERNEIDFHLHMVSTIPGSEDLFAGTAARDYHHQDEIWLWVPLTEQAMQHLRGFLNSFKSAPHVAGLKFDVEFLGAQAKEWAQIFTESFSPISSTLSQSKDLSMAILRFKAGAINSRKAMISPYLPRLIS